MDKNKEVKTYKTKTGTKIKQDSKGGKQFSTTVNIPGGNKTINYNYKPPKKK